MKKLFNRFLDVLGGAVFNSGKILVMLIIETLKAILMQLPWKHVLERCLTRTVVALLKWLKTLSSNELVDETLEDILYALRKTGLPEAKL